MAIARNNRKWFLLLAAIVLTTLFLMVATPAFNNVIVYEKEEIILTQDFQLPRIPREGKNWRGLNKNETDKLSVLGRILFLEEDPPEPRNSKETNYKILVWKYGSYIKDRHLKNYGSKDVDPFEMCSVKNCEVTFSDKDLSTADIVIFHLHRMSGGELPQERRNQNQIWAFLTDESPYHTFVSGKNKMADYNGVFNWSMTYRMDSDIPVPYGRTILRKNAIQPQVTITKRRDVLIAIMVSNPTAKNNRWKYVEELSKYITVHVYGRLGSEYKNTCGGHFKKDCPAIDEYLFYLAFENTNCDEYITEKLWWNAYHKNSIPIVMGASKASYAKLLPPNSYLNIDDYAQPKDLAQHVLYLNSTETFKELYNWKTDFEVLNEHGYFKSKSYHFCRACEALNYNDRTPKVYQNLTQFWSIERDCRSA